MQHRPYAAVTIAEIGGHDDPKRPVTINRNDRSRSPKYARKHANDVLRLSQLLAPDTRIPVAERIAQDLSRFLDAIETDRSIDPKPLKISRSVGEIADRIARAYGLNRPRET